MLPLRSCQTNIIVTCGNQCNLAREKNIKKLLEQKKKAEAGAREANAGLSSDARMRLKQEEAAAKKAAEEATKVADVKKVKKIDPLKM
ncbi:hypothetical protein RB195_003085 [Necator americanus]|uniref:4F5 family protein n=1 Tax=Necator americanus TaxID=51031 RepID=A0ABR1DLY5_NECAM